MDASIESDKEKNPFLKGVPAIVDAIKSGKIKCRVYNRDKFHAKAYIPETIRMVADSSSHQQNQMVISANTPIHNPIQTIETFNKRFALTQEEGELVKTSWQQEPIQNMWGVIQAFTASAKVPWLDVEW